MISESFVVPKTQKASIFEERNGPITVREIPVPEIDADDILIKIEYSGVCHSDLHIWNGELPIPLSKSFVGGHEGVGTVVKKGANVTNFEIGDKAGVRFAAMCFACESCKKGEEALCRSTGGTMTEGAGTFQQYARNKAVEAAKLPKDIDLSKAAPTLCAGLTVYRALKEANVRPGEWVAITGAGGGLGSMGVQYAKAMGMRVVAIDIPAKEEHCRKLGAEVFVNALSATIVDEIFKATNGGPHGVVNVATAEKALDDSVKYVRTKGTVVLVSLPKEALLKAEVFNIVFKCLTIKGSLIGTRKDADEAVDFVARGLVDVEETSHFLSVVFGHFQVPVEIHPLSALPAIYDRLEKGQINGRCVIDLWKE